MSDATGIAITGQRPGRALYVGRNHELYVARRYAIYRSDNWGATWRLDCFVPPSGWKPLAAKARLCASLLRYNIAAFQVLHDGSRVAVARDGVYRAGGERNACPASFRLRAGRAPSI